MSYKKSDLVSWRVVSGIRIELVFAEATYYGCYCNWHEVKPNGDFYNVAGEVYLNAAGEAIGHLSFALQDAWESIRYEIALRELRDGL